MHGTLITTLDLKSTSHIIAVLSLAILSDQEVTEALKENLYDMLCQDPENNVHYLYPLHESFIDDAMQQGINNNTVVKYQVIDQKAHLIKH